MSRAADKMHPLLCIAVWIGGSVICCYPIVMVCWIFGKMLVGEL